MSPCSYASPDNDAKAKTDRFGRVRGRQMAARLVYCMFGQSAGSSVIYPPLPPFFFVLFFVKNSAVQYQEEERAEAMVRARAASSRSSTTASPIPRARPWTAAPSHGAPLKRTTKALAYGATATVISEVSLLVGRFVYV